VSPTPVHDSFWRSVKGVEFVGIAVNMYCAAATAQHVMHDASKTLHHLITSVKHDLNVGNSRVAVELSRPGVKVHKGCV